MPHFKLLNKPRLKELRLLLISRPLRQLNLPKLRLLLKRLNKRLSDLLLRRKLKELQLKMPERKNKSNKLSWKPLLSKQDFKPLRMRRMLSKLPLKLKSKEERTRRGPELLLKRLKDSELKRLLLWLKSRDSKLFQMLKKQDSEQMSQLEENKLSLSNKPLMLLELNKYSKKRRPRKLLKPLLKLHLLQKLLLLKKELKLLEPRSRRIASNTKPLSKLNMSLFNKELPKRETLPKQRLMLMLPSKEWSKPRLLLKL